MKVVVVILVLAGLSACQLETKPLAVKKASAPKSTKDAGSADGAGSMDAALLRADARPSESERDGNRVALGDGATIDGASAAPNDATTPSDAAQTGPDVDAMPPQNGGLVCDGVFCPFTTDPIKPCCTARNDVERGSARAKNRCGLDFSATGKDFYTDLCWQRDQTGVLDSTCPDVSVDLRTSEPGCCSEQGRCGSVNTDNAIGCHYDPSAPAKTCGSEGQEPDAGTSCDPRGLYGLRTEIDMAWGGRTTGLAALTDDGRGVLTVHLLANVTDVDPDTLELTGEVRVCGVQLPTFYSSTLCEAYEPQFPNPMWESSAMPRFPLHGRWQCLESGCIESFEAQTVLIGINLPNPEAPWPSASDTTNLSCAAGKGAACFPDHDGDMLPGLSTKIATSGVATGGTACSRSYDKRGAPLSASVAAIFGGVRRTDRLQLGVRVKLGGSAKLQSACGGGTGVGIAEFVNSRSIGCLVQQGTYDFGTTRPAGANEACTATEAAFMDANLPLYNVLAVGKKPATTLNLSDTSASKGPQTHTVRLGDLGANVSCATVRAATYP